MGPAEFTAALAAEAHDHELVREIPKAQRHLGRPTLAEMFAAERADPATRSHRIIEAVERHGYGQKAVADWLGLHCSTVSRLVTRWEGLDARFKT